MANVFFKRGLSSALPLVAEDGVFYLTTDTNRLYVGQGNDMRLLNLNITVVSSIDELTNSSHNGLSDTWTDAEKAAHVEDFYYITGNGTNGEYSNILVVWKYDPITSGYNWVLINADHNDYVQSMTTTATAANKVGTIETSLIRKEGAEITSNFKIEAGAGLAIGAATASGATPGLLLEGSVASIERSVVDGQATVLVSNTNASTTSSVVFKAGTNVTLSSTGLNDIIISTDNDYVSAAALSLDENGNIDLSLTRTDGPEVTASLENVGIVLNNGTQYVKLSSTTSTMTAGAIYSKAEIDSMIKGLNGMTFKGTVSSELPTTNVSNGDVYVVSDSSFSVSSSATHVIYGDIIPSTFVVGDMFIASGTEDSNGVITSTIDWHYIPAGNDSLATVTYNPDHVPDSNQFTIRDGNEIERFGLTLAASTGINIVSTSAANGRMVSTFSHAAYSTTASTTASTGASFSAISGITIDNGHITGYTTETYSPAIYRFGDTLGSTAVLVASDIRDGSATSANYALLSINLNETTDNENIVSSLIIKLSSDNIKLSSTSNPGEVLMNFEWGSF